MSLVQVTNSNDTAPVTTETTEHETWYEYARALSPVEEPSMQPTDGL